MNKTTLSGGIFHDSEGWWHHYFITERDYIVSGRYHTRQMAEQGLAAQLDNDRSQFGSEWEVEFRKDDSVKSSHRYTLIERKDYPMEPVMNSKGELTTIAETSRCDTCGHLNTVVAP